MAKKKITNPLTRFGWWLLYGVLISYSVLLYIDHKELLSIVSAPLMFFCGLYLTVWVVFQYRTGEISMLGGGGRFDRFTRKKNKYFFFFYIITIFIMGLILTILVGSDVFLGCEGSMINTCYIDPATVPNQEP